MTFRARYIAYAVLLLAPLLALLPVARIGVDWVRVSRVAPTADFEPPARGYDWVEWADRDGLLHAAFVHPKGPAAEAGMLAGDVFHALDGQQYFTEEDLQDAIRGVSPGTSAVYTVMRGDDIRQIDVRYSRDPTFLYPVSSPLWQFSLWGFGIGAFLHVLGILIVAPLAKRSRKARFSLVLISVSSLWIIGNLVRLSLVELFGPPLYMGGIYDVVMRIVTLLGLAGWLAFPAMLLHKVALDARILRPGEWVALIPLYSPAFLFAVAAIDATITGSVGPLTLNELAPSILLFACTYIAASAALMFLIYFTRPDQVEDVLGRWNRFGSIVTLILSVGAALGVMGMVTFLPGMSEIVAGWLIVSTQLAAVAPVVLVSHATLQHGKVDLVLGRGIVYLALLGLFFFAFIAGTALIDPYLDSSGASRHVLVGLFVIALLLLFGRLARGVDVYASSILASDRRRARNVLAEFSNRMRSLLSVESLAREGSQVLARAFDARWAAIFIRPEGDAGPTEFGSYHPEPPFITARFASIVWPHLHRAGRVWAPNAELGGGTVPDQIANQLERRGVALAIPFEGGDRPTGLILLGEKRHRRAVYNLEDLDLVRGVAGQLVLALERLALVEREKALVRQSAEAHLVALRAQINPHFLFNALNTIAALITESPREAEETVEHVAAIFRHTLKAGSDPHVSLADELDLVSHYLHIEQIRFGEKLSTRVDVPPGLGSHPVPAFSVQTLVENAVKHGLEKKRGGGSVAIEARASDSHLTISVTDSGVGLKHAFGPETSTAFYGLGLRNVAARLEMLYGDSAALTHESLPAGGTEARLSIPLRDEYVDQSASRSGDGHPVILTPTIPAS